MNRKTNKFSRVRRKRPSVTAYLGRYLRRTLYCTLLALLLISVLPILILRWVDPPTSSFMLQSRWQAHGKGASDATIHYQWVNWERLSPHLKIAVIAAEDQRFPDHIGLDFRAIYTALQERRRGTRARGASTISQQVVKNLFLWPQPSWLRKGIEAWLTLLLEAIWPKQRVLEVYLNIAQWGEDRFGAQVASEYYFGKNARQLTRREATRLAAVLPNPVVYRADRPSAYIIRRERWIARQIRALGGVEYIAHL